MQLYGEIKIYEKFILTKKVDLYMYRMNCIHYLHISQTQTQFFDSFCLFCLFCPEKYLLVYAEDYHIRSV